MQKTMSIEEVLAEFRKKRGDDNKTASAKTETQTIIIPAENAQVSEPVNNIHEPAKDVRKFYKHEQVIEDADFVEVAPVSIAPTRPHKKTYLTFAGVILIQAITALILVLGVVALKFINPEAFNALTDFLKSIL